MITTVSKLGTWSRRWNTLSSVSYEAWMQAQQSVLGSVLIDDRCASFLVFGLAEEDFCESYRASRELYTTGKLVDPVAVLNVVGDSYKDFIVQLMNITPTAANCKMYVDIVKQQSRVLKLRDTGLALSRISTEEEGAELLRGLVVLPGDDELRAVAGGAWRRDFPTGCTDTRKSPTIWTGLSLSFGG